MNLVFSECLKHAKTVGVRDRGMGNLTFLEGTHARAPRCWLAPTSCVFATYIPLDTLGRANHEESVQGFLQKQTLGCVRVEVCGLPEVGDTR